MHTRRIKVLAIAPDLNQGGGENRILNIARTIDRSRFEYEVATLYSPDTALSDSCGSMAMDFHVAGVKVSDLGLRRPVPRTTIRTLQLASTALSLLLASSALWRYLRVKRIDVLDAHLDGSVYVGLSAARAARVPASITLYGAKAIDQRSDAFAWRRAGLRTAGAVVTDSHKVAADLAAFIGAPTPPILVVPNGVRLAAPQRSRAAVRADLRLPESATEIIGQVSGLVPYKGHRTLLRAAALVIAERPGAYFICIGFPRVGPDYVASLEQEARELGISNRVRFQSYPGNIADIWQVIDVHVHASDLDSLPNAIIEGMSLGKPAVVTAVGGVPELVHDERTGLLVAPGDPPALAAAILRLLRCPGFAAQLGVAATSRYLALCTPEVVVRALERSFIALHDRSARHQSRAARLLNAVRR